MDQAHSQPSTGHAFHLILRDNEEGGIHSSEVETYFSLSDELLAALSIPLGQFAHELVSSAYQTALRSGSDEVGMAPWFDVEELPAGSTVPQRIEDIESLEGYLLKAYKTACCIGWED